jgi:hypothetical protein
MQNNIRPKWSQNCAAAKYIVQLILQGQVKTTDTSKEAILALKRSHPIFAPYSESRFVINVRQLLVDFEVDQNLKGKRGIEQGK